MSYVKLWIHAVWGTKRRQPMMQCECVKELLIRHIIETSRNKGFQVKMINGVSDHLHALIRLKSSQTLDKIMQHIKGESAHWMNQQQLLKDKFKWSHRYYAASVSESHINRVESYIKNQVQHHKHQTWQQEYEAFMAKLGFVVASDSWD